MYQAHPHQQRVIDEKTELDEKRVRLKEFFETERYSELDTAEQARMRYQAVAMREYSAVLGERIAAFTV
jgi:hypothetical protein